MFGSGKATLNVFAPVFALLRPPSVKPTTLFVQGACVALMWVGLFLLNSWLFKQFAFSEQVSWIFLPAALRMLAVLVLGWVGVAGIFLGSAITGVFVMGKIEGSQILIGSALSALSPTLALLLCAYAFGMRANLVGLSASKLLILSVVAASFTAVLHNIHFALSGQVDAVGDSLLAMFIGDLVGTLVVLYLAKLILMALPLSGASKSA